MEKLLNQATSKESQVLTWTSPKKNHC